MGKQAGAGGGHTFEYFVHILHTTPEYVVLGTVAVVENHCYNKKRCTGIMGKSRAAKQTLPEVAKYLLCCFACCCVRTTYLVRLFFHKLSPFSGRGPPAARGYEAFFQLRAPPTEAQRLLVPLLLDLAPLLRLGLPGADLEEPGRSFQRNAGASAGAGAGAGRLGNSVIGNTAAVLSSHLSKEAIVFQHRYPVQMSFVDSGVSVPYDTGDDGVVPAPTTH